MLINEILTQLNETGGEIEDLHYLAKYITQFVKSKKPKGDYSINDIRNESRVPLNIHSVSVLSMVNELTFDFSPIDSVVLGGFLPDSFIIKIDLDKIKKYKNYSLESILVHELQHALDFKKSHGKSFTDAVFDKNKMDEYLRWKEEINARFSEVLLVIAKKSPSRSKLQSTMDKAFNERAIFRDLYEKGPKGQKQYNQLKKRAYKFYDEFVQIKSAESKSSFLGKVKSLISQFSLIK